MQQSILSSPALAPSSLFSANLAAARPTLPQTLTVEDVIHGDCTLTEPVLIELILSPAIQRLKHVTQHGISAVVGLTPTPVVTRYEHSVGAMLLVRKAGGSIEAQAAALLHDVAHTALSHVVDGVFGYVVHEDDKMEYLSTTSVPTILSTHGFDPAHVLHEDNFPLLELDAPAICADRLDYGIRDSLSFGFLTLADAQAISKDLRANITTGKFCFSDMRLARRLSAAYLKSDEYAWSNPLHSLLYEYAADTIKEALKHDVSRTTKSDLWREGGDEEFWAWMTQSPSSAVRMLAKRVDPTVHVVSISEAQYDALPPERRFRPAGLKIRSIDPDVLVDNVLGSVKRLSEVDEEYQKERDAYLTMKKGLAYFEVIHPEQA